MTEKRYISTDEAARLLGVSSQTVRNRIDAGKLAGDKTWDVEAGKYRYRVDHDAVMRASERTLNPTLNPKVKDKLASTWRGPVDFALTQIEDIATRYHERSSEAALANMERYTDMLLRAISESAATRSKDLASVRASIERQREEVIEAIERAGVERHREHAEYMEVIVRYCDAVEENNRLLRERARAPWWRRLFG